MTAAEEQAILARFEKKMTVGMSIRRTIVGGVIGLVVALFCIWSTPLPDATINDVIVAIFFGIALCGALGLISVPLTLGIEAEEAIDQAKKRRKA